MILPRMTAALLSMSFFGSAYANAELYAGTSLDQWVVICGAANGAAGLYQASEHDLNQHQLTARAHLTRFAAENGRLLLEFQPLFTRGQAEGKRLVEAQDKLFTPHKQALLEGFHNDKQIQYQDMKRVLGT
ncbi:MAG TPA: hypothetical protein VKZ66_12855 [Pusillimonas sp.]|uniref:hypothetical protein n=1 Tax=unclassified Pusillimonas TaxID=2640016 RepID=UPI002623CBC4|nr:MULTISPECIES: hypothetical protein [unclassified Pusillimonas]HLU20833.1 hypothetical protein [Pusillimonas sp.]